LGIPGKDSDCKEPDMNLPNDFPIPDLVGEANADDGSLPFPSLTAGDPAVYTAESFLFSILESSAGLPPAVTVADFSPPPMGKAAVASPASPFGAQAAEASGFDPAMLNALAADPIAARTLDYLRTQTADKLAALTDQVFSMLAPEEKPALSKSLPTGPTNIRTLMAASRNSELSAGIRRELAEGLVTGSVINLDNANWNPVDPASSTPDEKNLMCALLQMKT